MSNSNRTGLKEKLETAHVDLQTWNWIRSHTVFVGIPDEELRSILHFFTEVSLDVNEFLIEEGREASIDLYLVLSGNLEVIRRTDTSTRDAALWTVQTDFTIAALSSGDTFGELSFMKGGSRSASIRCTRASVLLSLSPDAFAQLEHSFPRSSSQMMKNMLGYVGERLKQTTDNEVNALKTKLQSSIISSKANLFFSYVIGLLCVYNLAIQVMTNLSMDANRASLISAGIIMVFSGVLVVMIRQSRLPIHFFGLSTRNWKPAVRESLLWSTIIIAVLIAVKWSLIQYVPRYSELTVFKFDPTHQKYLAFNFALYGLHSPIQEFIARGVLQGSLQHFFRGKHITFRAIVISNALFSATHVHLLGGLLGVIVFVPGLFWGWLYSRHENLIGVSISHIMIGWTALFFLNLESLF